MKKISLFLILYICIYNIYAQESYVFSAPKGTYITNIIGAASDAYPMADGTISVSIQRKQSTETNWIDIGNFTQPNSLEQLQKNFKRYSIYSPDLYFVNTTDIDKVWSKFVKANNKFDSCYNYIHEPAMGLAIGYLFLDSTVTAQTQYEYRLVKHLKVGGEQIYNLTSTIKWPTESGLHKPSSINIIGKSSHIALSYAAIGGKKPVYFKVFRQYTYFEKFEQIWSEFTPPERKTRDSIIMKLLDHGVVPDKDYRYYIIPVDAFGNQGPASDTVTVFTTDKKNMQLPEYVHTTALNSGIKVNWKLKNKGKIGYIEVYRGMQYDGEYKILERVTPSDTIYIDHTCEPMKTYYYYLKLVDKTGKSGFNSVRTYGLYSAGYAALPPVITEIAPDKKGIKITWKRSGHDVLGYYVYRGIGQASNDMKQLSGLIESKDSINTYIDTTQRIPMQGFSYTVSQENTSHKEGVRSRPVYIKTIADKSLIVSVPSLYITKIGKNALLTWKVKEGTQGISNYKLSRKTLGSNTNNDWSIIVPSGITIYSDTTTKPGNIYTYQIQAVHISGKESEISETNFDLSFDAPLPIENLVTSVTDDGIINLNWTASKNELVQGYHIYRFLRGSEEISMIANLSTRTESMYQDRTTEKGKTYGYFIKCIYGGDKESEPSIRNYVKREN